VKLSPCTPLLPAFAAFLSKKKRMVISWFLLSVPTRMRLSFSYETQRFRYFSEERQQQEHVW
jgi:hypothetical protein